MADPPAHNAAARHNPTGTFNRRRLAIGIESAAIAALPSIPRRRCVRLTERNEKGGCEALGVANP